MDVLAGGRPNVARADLLEVRDRVDLGLAVWHAEFGQRHQGLGSLVGPDRRADPHGRFGMGARPQLVHADNRGNAAAVRLKLSANSRSIEAEVWSISVTNSVICMLIAVAPSGTRASSLSRCRELKQTSGRPKYI